MTPIDTIKRAFEEEDGFTVNIWLRGGACLRNIALLHPSDGDTHLDAEFQETRHALSVSIDEIAALEIEL